MYARLRSQPQTFGIEVIDLYYQHRVDPIPYRRNRDMAELVQQGKVRYLGLSEAARQPFAVLKPSIPFPLQTEYSLWSREPEAEILPICRELDWLLCPTVP